MNETDQREKTEEVATLGYEREQEPGRLERNGRRYSVANQRGKVRSKLRYIESTHPSTSCRFL